MSFGLSEQVAEQTVKLSVIWDAMMPMWHHCNVLAAHGRAMGVNIFNQNHRVIRKRAVPAISILYAIAALPNWFSMWILNSPQSAQLKSAISKVSSPVTCKELRDVIIMTLSFYHHNHPPPAPPPTITITATATAIAAAAIVPFHKDFFP